MDNSKRQTLQLYQKDIVNDLDVKYIMDDLFTRNVLSRDVYDSLLSNIYNREKCVRLLLDSLLQNGDNAAYEGFVDSLSKHYRWLWEKLTLGEAQPGETDILTESTEDTLARSDVPRLPPHYVRREEQERLVVSGLEALRRYEVLTLHGMPGCGKTTVAAAALRQHPHLLHQPLYWLSLSDCRTDDDLLSQQLKLYRKASGAVMVRDTSVFSSTMSMSSLSLSSVADSHSISLALPGDSPTWRDMRDTLRTLFIEVEGLKEATVVLDDVCVQAVADAFDIGCKLLVTTRDLSIFANRRPQVITIESELTEAESLELFASNLRVDVTELPSAARRLHALCKGGPLQVSLLGAHLAENRERLLHDPSYWKHYVDKLTKKDFFTLIHMQSEVDPMRPVKMCINSLPTDLQPLFRQLAVLPDGVKISARALARLWATNETRVESLMRRLHTKSLVMQHYVKEEKKYLYEVHSLIVSCLRALHTAEDLRRLHSELLARYGFLQVPAAAPPPLPDDGYIAFYLAHHIHETGNGNNEWSLFNKLFLDLEFVGAKVRLAGQADVVMDLNVYQDQICPHKTELSLLEELREWLGAHGADLHRFPHTDLLQSVLQHSSAGPLYARAYELAQKAVTKYNRLYFTFLHEANVEESKYKEIDVGEAVTSICFLRDYILVGLQSGNIKVFDTRTHQECGAAEGDGSAVVWLGACPINLSRVASLDASGLLRLRSLYLEPSDRPDRDELDGVSCDECESESADEVEIEWLKEGERAVRGGEHGTLLHCCWMHRAELIAAHTSTSILLYSGEGLVRSVLPVPSGRGRIMCCALTQDDAGLLVGSEVAGRSTLDLYLLSGRERLLTFTLQHQLFQILTLPNDSSRVLAVSSAEVTEHWWQSSVSPRRSQSRSVVRSEEVTRGLGVARATLSAGGDLLFLATDDARVLCIHLLTRAHILDLPNPRGNVLCMDVSQLWLEDYVQQYDVLATADQDRTLRLWKLDTAYTNRASADHRKARLTGKFACGFPCAPVSPASGRTSPRAAPPPPPLVARPRRVNSEATQRDTSRTRTTLRKTGSLSDRNSLRLNLNGISSTTDERAPPPPLLAVLDDKNNVQIMVGRRVFAEVASGEDCVSALQVSPCGRYVVLGLRSGLVNKFTLRSKETHTLCDLSAPVLYLEFVTPDLLVAAGRNGRVMAHRKQGIGDWRPLMLQSGNAHLGSQELLDDINGTRRVARDASSDGSGGGGVGSTGTGRLCRTSVLIKCWWVEGAGLVTVEENGIVKLWEPRHLRMARVLSGRRTNALAAVVTCADMQAHTLALATTDDSFQTLRLRIRVTLEVGEEQTEPEVRLEPLQEERLNSRITACSVSRSGLLLACGLHNGNIVLWNVRAKFQVALLKQHKTSVTSLLWSPEPTSGSTTGNDNDNGNDLAPLVLVSCAAELVWWDVSYIARSKRRHSLARHSKNILTPVQSPDSRSALTPSGSNALSTTDSNDNTCFFQFNTADAFQQLWRGKQGVRRREELGCVKLAGVSARRVLADDAFRSFTTVDCSGVPHLLHVLPPQHTD